MRKTTFRKKLALMLSAAMVFTMAAPAKPAHAAGKITFDFKTLNPSVGTIQDITITGAAGVSIPTGTPAAGTFFANGSGNIYMPYWNGTAFDKTGSHASFNAKTFDLTGYKIQGWYRTRADVFNNTKKHYMEEQTYPYVDKSYMALLESDGTLYNFTVKHAPAVAGSVAPDLINNKTSTTTVPVLQTVQASAENVPGFKMQSATSKVGTINTTTGATINAGDTGTNFKVVGEQVNGTMVNKPVEVEFKYMIDSDQKFGIKVVHNLNGVSVTDRTLREYEVNTDLATVADKVTPDHSLIEAQPGEPTSRYRLATSNPVVITNALGTAFTTNSSLIGPNDAANAADKIKADVLPALASGDTDPNPINGLLTGKMINQGLTVTYNYVPNPGYYMTLSVRYEDTNGADLTDAVAAKLTTAGNIAANVGASTSTQPALTTSAGAGSRLVYKVGTTPGQNFTIYAPVLDGYETSAAHAPALSAGDATQYSNSNFNPLPTTGWTAATPTYTVNTGAAPNGSAEVVVTYTPDTANLVQTNFVTDIGGDLQVGGAAFDPISNPAHAVTFVKQNKNPLSHTFDINLTAAQLPTPKPNDGYKFTGWQLDKNDGSTPAGFQNITLPATVTANDQTNNIFKFKAKFDVDPNQWSEVNFEIGDPSQITDNGLSQQLKIVNRSGGNPIQIAWNNADIVANVANVSLNPGVTGKVIKWYDANNQEMKANPPAPEQPTPIVHTGTYKAYAVSATSGTVHTPTVNGVVDPVTGTPSLNVDTSVTPIDPALNYVVTDDAGNVVLVVPGTSLLPSGVITGAGIDPGYTYNVHTAQPSTPGITVGSPIPSDPANISGASGPITIPATANAPAVGEDPNNVGRRTITVNPTSPNTEYRLVDAAGNEVSPYVSPIGGQVVFDDLDPSAVYTVVPRRTGDTVTAPPVANGVAVNTGVLTPVILPRTVNLILPAGVTPSVIKIDGIMKNVADLASILPGKSVEVTVPTLHGTKLFTGTFITSGIATPAPGSNMSFTMPNNDVTIQALYTAAGVSWDAGTPPSTTGTGANPAHYVGSAAGNVAVEVPDITDPGTYRLRIERDTNVPASLSAFIQAQEADIPYTGLWQAKVIVEVWDAATSAWEPYTGAVDPLRATLTTGSLVQGSREYRLYESVASASNATRVSGTFEGDWTSPSYSGSFQTEVNNGTVYTFGYIEHPSYNVRVKSTRETGYNQSVFVRRGLSLYDYAASYENEITRERNLPEIDVDGVTWTFRGLSSSRTEFMEYNERSLVSGPGVVYIYFDNDRTARNRAQTELTNAVNEATTIANNSSPAIQASIQALINDANAVLTMTTPRRASRQELNDAYIRLRDGIMALLGGRSGGSGYAGGSGGSGGSGVSYASRTVNGGNSIKVGYDGNWNLIDAQNHIWNFDLSSGGKAIGWAKLAYTYEGTTKTRWYNFRNDGVMNSGWLLDAGKWYSLSLVHDGFFGEMLEGWYLDNSTGRWYYLNGSGAMATGWNNIGGSWYYLSTTHNGYYGEMIKGWFFDNTDNKWYYLNGDGAMVTGWNKIGGKWYYFTVNKDNKHPYGSLYVDSATPDGYTVNTNGEWIQ